MRMEYKPPYSKTVRPPHFSEILPVYEPLMVTRDIQNMKNYQMM